MKNKKYLVRANENWKNKNLKCNDFNPKRIPEVGEEWEVDGARLETLLGDNSYNVAFVEVIAEKHQDWRVSPPFKTQNKKIKEETNKDKPFVGDIKEHNEKALEEYKQAIKEYENSIENKIEQLLKRKQQRK